MQTPPQKACMPACCNAVFRSESHNSFCRHLNVAIPACRERKTGNAMAVSQIRTSLRPCHTTRLAGVHCRLQKRCQEAGFRSGF